MSQIEKLVLNTDKDLTKEKQETDLINDISVESESETKNKTDNVTKEYTKLNRGLLFILHDSIVTNLMGRSFTSEKT